MQVRFANRDEFAWDRGEKAFEPGDTLAAGVRKAEQAGFRPGCNGYSAFITAFSRCVRQYQEHQRRMGSTLPAAMPQAAVAAAPEPLPGLQAAG